MLFSSPPVGPLAYPTPQVCTFSTQPVLPRYALTSPIDRQAKAVRDWNIKGLPTTFIVGRAGKVRWQTMEPQDFSGETMREIFEVLLAERP